MPPSSSSSPSSASSFAASFCRCSSSLLSTSIPSVSFSLFARPLCSSIHRAIPVKATPRNTNSRAFYLEITRFRRAGEAEAFFSVFSILAVNIISNRFSWGPIIRDQRDENIGAGCILNLLIAPATQTSSSLDSITNCRKSLTYIPRNWRETLLLSFST